MNVLNHRRSGLRKGQKGLRADNRHFLELRNRGACFLSESKLNAHHNADVACDIDVTRHVVLAFFDSR